VELTDDERRLVLATLFEMRTEHWDDDELGRRIESLVLRLDGDVDGPFYGGEIPLST
jgi:hypothetical protein